MKNPLNRANLYKGIKQVTPPFILDSLRGAGLYASTKRAMNRMIPSDMRPSWAKVLDGDLKGRELYMDPSGPWQREILEGTYDSFLFDRIKRHGAEGKTFFDIGSHIGFSAMYFAQLTGPKGKVIAFEPNPANVRRFKETLAKNADLAERIHIEQIAVSSGTGVAEFSFSEDIESGLSSGGFLREADTHLEKDSYEGTIGFARTKVNTLSLDELLTAGNQPVPDIIKIDVEGAEYLVLEGARKTLRDHSPLLLIEIHSIFNMFRASQILGEAGYVMELLNEEKDGRCFVSATKA